MQILQDVRDALGKHRNQVRKNGQAVTLYYESWPNVDIVPVWQSADYLGNVTHYNVPNAVMGTWIESTPKTHTADIESRARICGSNFRKVIKMMKYWNASHGEYLQSYHIEVMALKTFTSEMSDLPWDLYSFFKSCNALIATQLWHSRGFADAYLNYSDREEAKKRLAAAESKALSAWHAGYKNNNADAIVNWKRLFRDSFPPYG